MALVVCKECEPPVGSKNTYVKAVEPLGYPDDTAAICGRRDCNNPGLVWLTTQELEAYEAGERIIEIPNNAVKIKVK